MRSRNRRLYDDFSIFFITTCIHRKIRLLEIGNGMDIVIDNLKYYTEKYDVKILGYVLMPNHIHLLLHFGDSKLRSSFMRDFKKYSSVQFRNQLGFVEPGILEKFNFSKGKQKFKIWADSFDESFIDSRDKFEQKLEYIHNNPLQAHWNLVDSPEKYKFSSAMFYENGIEGVLPTAHYHDFT